MKNKQNKIQFNYAIVSSDGEQQAIFCLFPDAVEFKRDGEKIVEINQRWSIDQLSWARAKGGDEAITPEEVIGAW